MIKAWKVLNELYVGYTNKYTLPNMIDFIYQINFSVASKIS